MGEKDKNLPPRKRDTKERMDNPEQYPTDKESMFDRDDSELNVDPIPLEDVKEEQREEEDGEIIKDTSSSEKKYKSDE
ncbi:hypothetical protein [Pseudalkalibacillus caeni]|uniref:Uncharacterized protein n=1 Tax=Exobacillus caeni TaxID=2574798 RepID=A0A5R9FBI3_9BACL|nr:hypothetical protein [Pseudalkalibacillus caeni]TLS39038.1 hypothetical protein FCL54_01635 [Pseudalkalibacillus caeni]